MEEIYRLFITILGTHPFDLARSKIFRFPFLLYRTTLQKKFFFFFSFFQANYYFDSDSDEFSKAMSLFIK